MGHRRWRKAEQREMADDSGWLGDGGSSDGGSDDNDGASRSGRDGMLEVVEIRCSEDGCWSSIEDDNQTSDGSRRQKILTPT